MLIPVVRRGRQHLVTSIHLAAASLLQLSTARCHWVAQALSPPPRQGVASLGAVDARLCSAL